MNDLSTLPRTRCPACDQPLRWWPRGWPVYHCQSCQRPLARYIASLSPRIYRILPAFALVRIVSSVTGLALLLLLLATDASISSLVWVIAVLLGVYGATDAADGFIAVATGKALRGRQMLVGQQAKVRGWGTIAFGLTTCVIAAIGFVVTSIAP